VGLVLGCKHSAGRLGALAVRDMNGHFTPRQKWQLIEWLAHYWPESRTKFKRMAKRQLYAIYYTRLREVRPTENTPIPIISTPPR